MPRYITLKLVNEQGTPHPWPGTDTPFEVGSEVAATPVWIGVSADGSDNQIYPLDTDPQAILGSWPHLYQGVQLNLVAPGDDSPLEPGPGEYVYYNSLEEFNRLVAACCIADVVPDSPSESPGGPISQQMLFGFGPTQTAACQDDLEPFYVDINADPDDMEGVTLYLDAELTDPALFNAGAEYVSVNGRVYLFEASGTVMTPLGDCMIEALRFAPDLPNPGTEVAFWLVVPSGDPYEMFVDWGDGSPEEQYNGFDELPSHVYADAGQYVVRVRFTVNPTIVQNLELLNTPMTEFRFNPDWSSAVAFTTLHLAQNGLTDAALANVSFPQSINTIILEDNQLSNAIFAHLEDVFVNVLNLNENPINSVTGIAMPPQLNVLYMQLTGLAAFDPIWDTQELATLELQNNALTGFDIDSINIFPMGTLNLSGNQLPTADVDAVLVGLEANSSQDNGSVFLNGQTPAAPPTATGLAAQAALEARGWTVSVDS